MNIYRFKNRTLVVSDDQMQETLALATRAARCLAPVLICGESGTGKELVARYIHEKSERATGSFISVNCAAIPEGLMEAELFGYERGSFTGAIAQRIGKFERANGGTLLLDEISEMPVTLQAKLLRVLQEGEVDRLGGKDPIRVNARIIATTNREPLHLIREEKFRSDLFYRLNVIRIDCSPLRGREKAVRTLAQEFMVQACERQDRPSLDLANTAIEKLVAHDWPGNVRELQNAIERAVLLNDGTELNGSHFDLRRGDADAPEMARSLEALEKNRIFEVLGSNGGNRTQAAKELGISIRTLRNRLRDYRGE